MTTKINSIEGDGSSPVPSSPLPRYTHEDGKGPKCPFCEAVWTADDPMYYDESGFEDDCPECGNRIRIQPVISVSWKTLPIRWATSKVAHPIYRIESTAMLGL